jgi:hypothetical protein
MQEYIFYFKVADGVWSWQLCTDEDEGEIRGEMREWQETLEQMLEDFPEPFSDNGWHWAPTLEALIQSDTFKKYIAEGLKPKWIK